MENSEKNRIELEGYPNIDIDIDIRDGPEYTKVLIDLEQPRLTFLILVYLITNEHCPIGSLL
jgi:hypothetical protein